MYFATAVYTRYTSWIARLFITGNLSVSLEDPKYLWESKTTNNHSNFCYSLD